MKKITAVAFFAIACNSGCTIASLERRTLNQNGTTSDIRYQEVMDNLAMVAHEPSKLPSYSSIYSGTISVQDQGGLISTTTLPFGAGSQAINPSANRQALHNWALDPITAPEKMEAIGAACQWAIFGEDRLTGEAKDLLIHPENAPPSSNRHFGVADKLAELPKGWLCVGARKDVPACARYSSHCGDTWVWVLPENMGSLSAFTLVVQNIARVGINSQTLYHFPPKYTPINFPTNDQKTGGKTVIVQALVTPQGALTRDPYVPTRIDTAGNDSQLRSAVSAAGIAAPR
jgi:hypothetical protein